MKKGKRTRERYKMIGGQGMLLFVAILFMTIAYAQISGQQMTVEADVAAEAQDGVFIADVVSQDTTNGKINYYQDTILSSQVTLENSSSTVTYEVTLYNNSSEDYVYIGELIDENAYSNESIGYTINGLTKYETTIASKESLTFTITFAYIEGADTSNNTLESIINFRFKELPIIDLSNENETYTLENIYPGYTSAEYQFVVQNYTETDTNYVPMTYSFETTIDSPLQAKTYDESGNEVTGEINLKADGTTEEHTYTLKIIWDANDTEYEEKDYTCNVKLIAKPTDEKYVDYEIVKEFNVNITTGTEELPIIPISTVEQLLKIGSNEQVTIDGTTYTFSSNANYELQNDITFAISDYIDQYPDAFEGGSTTIENQISNFETANSEDSPYYTYTAPATGTYKLEVWGAQGGYRSSSTYGGLGGYSIGTITLTQGDNLYVYVGGAGGNTSTKTSGIVAGGYNGGGYRYGYKGGGGATDIRFTAGTWNDFSSLLSRVIVAGGGGSDGGSSKAGAYGGGTSGGDSSSGYTANSSYCGKGGEATFSGYSTAYTITTQTTTGLNSNTLANYAGGFGFGGGGVYLNSGYGGAGGGGWYGGSGVVPDSSVDDDKGGGGGSGYVWTSETASNVPSGYTVGTEYYLTDAATYGGNTSFASTSGSTETGHSGDGYARITLVSGTADSTVWKDCETQIENGTLTGTFEYNGYTITVGNTSYPSIPTVTAKVSDITTEGALITAEGKDTTGKTLQYTLTIDEKTYGPSETKEWTITELYDNTTYPYTIEVTNGKYTGTMTGEFTTETLTVTAEASDITTTTATITAEGTEAGGDTLQYTLTINGTTYGPSTTKEWNVTNLADNTTHSYTVEVTDRTNTETYTSSLKTNCIHNFASGELPEGAGTKFTTTAEYSDGTNTAVIPAGFTVSGATAGTCTKCGASSGETTECTIADGLVIYLIDDKTEAEIETIDWANETTLANLQQTYDQFVWIPISDINDMYMCQSEDGTKSCNITVQAVDGENKAYCTTHSSSLMAGRLYATSTGNNYNASLTTQTYTSGSGLREPDVVTGSSDGTGTSYDGSTTYLAQLNGILGTSYASASDLMTDLQDEYNQIVKSVYQNQGFYIGRYETSGMKNTNTNATVKIVAGSDNSTNANISSVTWYRMYAQQKKYAENKGLTSSIGSAMIQGAAYDQVMKFIDPTTSFVKTSGRVSHDIFLAYQTGGLNYSSVYTGTVEYNDVAKNIYDLEGNVWAWTTEAYTRTLRVVRGGNYLNGDSPSNRYYYNPDTSNTGYGSVLQLYVK